MPVPQSRLKGFICSIAAAEKARKEYRELYKGEITPCMFCSVVEFYYCQETGYSCYVFKQWVGEVE